MTTPRSVHSMGCATYIFRCVLSTGTVTEAYCETNRSLASGNLGEAVGAEDRGYGNKRVVPEMHQEAGKNAAGAGAHERENDADKDQHGDESPGPTQLRAVHQAK